mgnify:CR=1 FL=1
MTPSEKYKKPVIGTIVAQLSGKITQNGKTVTLALPEDTFEVIEIISQAGHKTYVCNQWNSPGIVQVVPEVFVKKFISK